MDTEVRRRLEKALDNLEQLGRNMDETLDRFAKASGATIVKEMEMKKLDEFLNSA